MQPFYIGCKWLHFCSQMQPFYLSGCIWLHFLQPNATIYSKKCDFKWLQMTAFLILQPNAVKNAFGCKWLHLVALFSRNATKCNQFLMTANACIWLHFLQPNAVIFRKMNAFDCIWFQNMQPNFWALSEHFAVSDKPISQHFTTK